MNPKDIEALARDGRMLGKDFSTVLADIDGITHTLVTRVQNKAYALRCCGHPVDYKELITETLEEMEAQQKARHRQEKAAVEAKERKAWRKFYVFYVGIPLAVVVILLIALFFKWV